MLSSPKRTHKNHAVGLPLILSEIIENPVNLLVAPAVFHGDASAGKSTLISSPKCTEICIDLKQNLRLTELLS